MWTIAKWLDRRQQKTADKISQTLDDVAFLYRKLRQARKMGSVTIANKLQSSIKKKQLLLERLRRKHELFK